MPLLLMMTVAIRCLHVARIATIIMDPASLAIDDEVEVEVEVEVVRIVVKASSTYGNKLRNL